MVISSTRGYWWKEEAGSLAALMYEMQRPQVIPVRINFESLLD